MKKHGFLTDESLIIADEYDVSTAGSLPNMINVGGNTNGKVNIKVFASTDFAVASSSSYNIELECFTADTEGSATSPITNGHVYLLHKTTADGAIAVDEGNLITEFVIPPDLLGANNWINIKTLGSATGKIDVFASILI